MCGAWQAGRPWEDQAGTQESGQRPSGQGVGMAPAGPVNLQQAVDPSVRVLPRGEVPGRGGLEAEARGGQATRQNPLQLPKLPS